MELIKMVINHIKEIFGILFTGNGNDESTAIGVLKSINNGCLIQTIPDRIETKYQVVLDDFNITISKQLDMSQNPMGGVPGSFKYHLFGQQYYYKLSIDDVVLDVSQRTNSKIFKAIIDILEEPNRERENYIKKDAKIHFN